jgi:cytoskeletal protein RodZ
VLFVESVVILFGNQDFNLPVPDHSAPPPTDSAPILSGDAPAPLPELVALGRRITAARQARGLDLDDLARRLCIGHEQLEALENADTSRLPELVFVIAQVRRVAASLDVDAEEAVAALRAFAPSRTAADAAAPPRPKRPDTAQCRSPSPNPGVPATAGPRRMWPLLAGSLLVITTAAVGLGVQWHRGVSSPSGTGQPNGAPRAGSGAIAGDGNPPPAAATRPAAPAGPALLVLRSKEPSWLEVRDSQGDTLFKGSLEGEKSFPLGQGLRVMAGRPDVVQAEVAGQEPRVLGPIDQVIWRSFTAAPGNAAATGEAPAPPMTPAP